MKGAGRVLPALRTGRLPTSTVLVRPTLTKPHVRGHAIKTFPSQRKVHELPTHFLDVATPHPGLKSIAAIQHTKHASEEYGTQITTLPNGIRVVSEYSKSPSATVGVTINAGNRLCTDENRGAFHLMERMSFKSTNKMDASILVKQLEELGGMAIAQCTRENIMYYIDCLRDQAGLACELLADSIFNPKLEEKEIEEQKRIAQIQYEDQGNEPTQIILELLHKRAYGNVGLGFPIIASPDELQKLSKQSLKDLMDMYYVGKNIVVASVGLAHDDIVERARKLFANVPAEPAARVRSKISPQIHAYEPDAHKHPEKTAKWIGGMDLVEELPRTEALPPNYRPQTHVAIAFEGVSTHGDDIYTVSVLNILLGGGGSFSQGGPGKGMYSKFYTDLLCQHKCFESVNSLVMMTNDTGIYGAVGSCTRPDVATYIAAVLDALMNVPFRIEEDELQRAKNQLKSSVLTNLENRGINFEDMTRQVLGYGTKRSTEEMLRKIDEVTLDQCKIVAAKCVQSKPAVVVYGIPESLETAPDFREIENYVYTQQKELKKKILS